MSTHAGNPSSAHEQLGFFGLLTEADRKNQGRCFYSAPHLLDTVVAEV